MSNLVEHAKKEFEILGWNDLPEDDMQTWVVNNLLELLEVFSKQGHSGSSAPYVINLFKRLANFGIIAELTGEDDEWVEVMDGHFQNKRCSEVFKDSKDGKAYWGFGRVFTDGESPMQEGEVKLLSRSFLGENQKNHSQLMNDGDGYTHGNERNEKRGL